MHDLLSRNVALRISFNLITEKDASNLQLDMLQEENESLVEKVILLFQIKFQFYLLVSIVT